MSQTYKNSSSSDSFWLSEPILPPKVLINDDCLKVTARLLKDFDILTEQSLSLRDPITYNRINKPCRSFSCKHIQCFDYNCYLQLNIRKQSPNQYLCPICKVGANPAKVYIDLIWATLLEEFSQVDTILLTSDGTFTTMETANTKTKQKHIIIDLDNDMDNDTIHTYNQNQDGHSFSLGEWKEKDPPKSFRSTKQIDLNRLSNCDIDDVLYFINNCHPTELEAIHAVGRNYCQKVIESRPFYCSSFLNLKQDLLIRIKKLKTNTADAIVDDIYKFVQYKLLQLKEDFDSFDCGGKPSSSSSAVSANTISEPEEPVINHATRNPKRSRPSDSITTIPIPTENIISNMPVNDLLLATPCETPSEALVKNEADKKMSPRTLLPSCSLNAFVDLTDLPLPKKMRKESMVHITDVEFAPLPRLAGRQVVVSSPSSSSLGSVSIAPSWKNQEITNFHENDDDDDDDDISLSDLEVHNDCAVQNTVTPHLRSISPLSPPLSTTPPPPNIIEEAKSPQPSILSGEHIISRPVSARKIYFDIITVEGANSGTEGSGDDQSPVDTMQSNKDRQNNSDVDVAASTITSSLIEQQVQGGEEEKTNHRKDKKEMKEKKEKKKDKDKDKDKEKEKNMDDNDNEGENENENEKDKKLKEKKKDKKKDKERNKGDNDNVVENENEKDKKLKEKKKDKKKDKEKDNEKEKEKGKGKDKDKEKEKNKDDNDNEGENENEKDKKVKEKKKEKKKDKEKDNEKEKEKKKDKEKEKSRNAEIKEKEKKGDDVVVVKEELSLQATQDADFSFIELDDSILEFGFISSSTRVIKLYSNPDNHAANIKLDDAQLQPQIQQPLQQNTIHTDLDHQAKKNKVPKGEDEGNRSSSNNHVKSKFIPVMKVVNNSAKKCEPLYNRLDTSNSLAQLMVQDFAQQ